MDIRVGERDQSQGPGRNITDMLKKLHKTSGAKSKINRETIGDGFFLKRKKEKNTAGRGGGHIFQGLKIILRSLVFARKWGAVGGLSRGLTGSDLHFKIILLALFSITILTIIVT